MSDNNISYELQQIQSTLAALTERLAASTATQVGGMQMYIAVGWSPIIALTDDGTYYYAQIIDWTGGSGIKPPVLQYLCETGWTYNVAEAARVGIVGGGLPDGDKGDITVASGIWTIDNGVVTTAKMGGDVTTAGKAMLTAADAAAQLSLIGAAAASHTHTLSNLTQSGATTGQVVQWNGTAWVPATPGAGVGSNYQIFTIAGSHTWTNPSPLTRKLARARLIGGGPGGGSGRKGAPGTVRCGGGGGAGACVNEFWFWTDLVPASVAVTVGSGGAGGASVTTDSTNGNPGLPGGVTSFNGWLGYFGNPGQGGTNASGAGGTAFGNSMLISGIIQTNVAGASAPTNGGPGGGLTSNSQYIPTGAGAGGGITAANVPSAGGNAQNMGSLYTAAPTAPGYGGAVGTNGSQGGPVANGVGFGGGGGGGSITGNAGNGAAGNGPGGPGGGGGAATDGVGNSGAGGSGADGLVEIIVFL